MPQDLLIALPKGRVLHQAVTLLAAAGIRAREDPANSRLMILPCDDDGPQLLVVRPADVATYVTYGAADVGIVGSDMLLEHDGGGLYEPMDLGIGRCRLMLAAPGDHDLSGASLRVATKHVNATRRYFARKGRQVEIIRLHGSIELAPLVGMADAIVDLVDTGETLRLNGLEPREHISDVCARLVVNKAAMKIKHSCLHTLISRLRRVVDQQQPGVAA